MTAEVISLDQVRVARDRFTDRSVADVLIDAEWLVENAAATLSDGDELDATREVRAAIDMLEEALRKLAVPGAVS